jgi:FkbM family methyltransferase
MRDTLLRKAICALAPRQITLTRKLRNGVRVGGPNRPGYGGRGVFILGDAIEPELDMLDLLISRSHVVVDVGANSGIYSLKGAAIVGRTGHVISLEPNPEMLAVLARNVRRNGFEHVRLRCLAASDRCSAASLYENRDRPNRFSLSSECVSTKSFSVLEVSVDSLMEWEGLGRLDFLKIDAEGAEEKVLAGARQSIAKFQPVILAEIIRDDSFEAPRGYAVFRNSASPNSLLVPSGHKLHDSLPTEWRPASKKGRTKPTTSERV